MRNHIVAGVCFSFLSMQAHAGQLFICQNTSGHEIVGTDEIVPDCPKDKRLIFGVGEGGVVLRGCWDYVYGKAHAIWKETGKEYMYDLDQCRAGDALEELIKKKNEKNSQGPQT